MESDIHHPMDAGLIADGVRVITRTVEKLKKSGHEAAKGFRDRTRSIKKRLFKVSNILRGKSGDKKEQIHALDKDGNLVIIENKLDDSGRDVTWQALKYASYCSSLSKEEIRVIFQDYLTRCGSGETAEEKLCDFYGKEYDEILLNKGTRQRIILVAAKFRC